MFSPVTVGKLWTSGDPKSLLQASLGSISQVNTKGSSVPFCNSLESHYVPKLHKFSRFRDCPGTQRSHHPGGTFRHEIPRNLLVCYLVSPHANNSHDCSKNFSFFLVSSAY